MVMKFKNLKSLKLSVIILGLFLAFLVGLSFSATPTLDIYLDNLPSTASYVIDTDDTNYWATRYDGKVLWDSTNASYIWESVRDGLPNFNRKADLSC